MSIFKRSLTLAAADFTRKALLAATVLLCVRLLPSATFGDYMFLLSFYQVFSVIGGAGFPNSLVRDVARHGIEQPHLLAGSTLGRAVYLAAAGAAMCVAMVLGGYPAHYDSFLLILILLTVARALSENLMAIFQGHHDQLICAKIGVLQSIGTLAGVLVVCLTSKDLQHLLAAHVFGAILSSVYGISLLRWTAEQKHGSNLFAGWHKARFLLRDSTWMNGGAFLASAYNRVDVLLLRRLSTAESVALYSAPYRLLDLTQIIPASVMGVVLPRLCGSEPENVPTARILRLLLVTALALVLVITLTSHWIVRIFLGARYAESATVLCILVWATIPMFWNFVLNSRLIAAQFERAIAWAAAAALVFNAGCNWFLIPRYGFFACAFVTLATEWGLLLLNFYFVSRETRAEVPERPLRLIFSAILLLIFCVLWTSTVQFARPLSLAVLLVALATLPLFRRDLHESGILVKSAL